MDKGQTFGKVEDYFSEQKIIQSLAKQIRSFREGCIHTWKEPAEWALKYSNLYKKEILALTITLSPTGCDWAINGGCTMCGEFEGSSKKHHISEEFHIAQFATALANLVPQYKPQWLRIEQEGNFANSNEVGFDAQQTILKLASSMPEIKRITIEARPQYLKENTVKKLKESIVDNTIELEIGMGLEAQNDVVRNICINKGESKNDFIRAVQLLNEYEIFPLAYVLLKPPFLNESESLNEAVDTIRYANEIGFKRISLEPMSIHKYTIVDALFNVGCYQVPWLWSVIEVIKQCADIPELGVGGVGYYPRPKYLAQNSHENISSKDSCNKLIWEALKHYSRYRDSSVFKQLDCECKAIWLSECAKQSKNLKERIKGQLSQIDLAKYRQTLDSEESVEAQNSIIIAGGSQSHYVRR